MRRALLLLALLAASACAHPLASHVLVVYITNDADSVTVANYYQAARGVPDANMCGLTPNAAYFNQWADITPTDWATYYKTPIQACLNAAPAGKTGIWYIVLAYWYPARVNGYSIDSYVADVWDVTGSDWQGLGALPASLQPYYAVNAPATNSYVPFVSMAQFRVASPTATVYSVFRLSGATPAAAQALVDRAIAAENAGGVKGQACVDPRTNASAAALPYTGYSMGEWDLYGAGQWALAGRLTLNIDYNTEEFGTAPAPATCLNAALYAGWYSYNEYTDVFGTWPTGAVGWHLDSYSMGNLRTGDHTWSAGALAHGITVTTGSVAEPFVTGFVRADGAFRDLLAGNNVGDAFLRNTRYLKWQITNVGDPLYQPFIGRITPARSGVLRGQTNLRGNSRLH